MKLKDKATRETRYCISDGTETKAACYAVLVRGHRSIENRLHWHMDITFREDACRAGKGFASQNLSVLRKVAAVYYIGAERQVWEKEETLQGSLRHQISEKTIGILMRLP